MIASPVLLLVMLSQAPATGPAAPSPRALAERAAAAIGSIGALRALPPTVLEFQSASFGLGQEESPGSPPRATLAYGRIVTDWQRERRAVEQESRAVTGVVTRTRQVVADGIGMTQAGATQAPAAPGVVVNALRELRLQPHRLVLAALDSSAVLGVPSPITLRGEMVDGLRLAVGADTMRLWFDRPTGRLLASEMVTDDQIMGDRRTLTWYTRWQEVTGAGGVLLPRQVDTEVNGRLLSHNVVTAARVATPADLEALGIPDSIAARAQRGPPAPPVVAVTLVALAPGVWRAEGGSHHSLVVDQSDRLIVVEAPQNATRTNAVLDTLASRFPGRPVATLVNSHHHWDHSGGVRAALARGIPVTTHARNIAFVRAIGSAVKTVNPDTLARGARMPPLRFVADTATIGSGERRLVLMNLPSVHAEGILAAYLPGPRLLFVVDVLTPGPTLAQAGSAEVVALVRARGLTVDRVVGGHGGIAEWANVVRAAEARP